MDIKLYILIKINGETKLGAAARCKVWADLGGIVGVFVLVSIRSTKVRKFVTLSAMFWLKLARVSISATNV